MEGADEHTQRLERELEQRARLLYVSTNYMSNFMSAVNLANPENLEAVIEHVEGLRRALDEGWLGLREARRAQRALGSAPE